MSNLQLMWLVLGVFFVVGTPSVALFIWWEIKHGKNKKSIRFEEECDISDFTICLGKDKFGNDVKFDLDKMNHLLIGGATGSGKSVCIHQILIQLCKNTYRKDLQLMLIDLKRVELSAYEKSNNLICPIIEEASYAFIYLSKIVGEMEARYVEMKKVGARNISKYNAWCKSNGKQGLARVLIVVDEFAELKMNAPKELQNLICRITQLGRAAGIHMVIATQRPSAKVITGEIKTNLTSRIALRVNTRIDSRIVLDQSGAELLSGNGDMLFSLNGDKVINLQGTYVSEDEVDEVISGRKYIVA